ncbi:MAG TPA: hypothetical protein VMY76_13785 [Gemmatimonadales bacterium]|nr:hypothetical protein [Gemmatimonadales bacterium]
MTRAPACWTLPLVAIAVLAACGSEPNPPATLDCSAVTPTTLAPGQFTILDASQSACVRLPGAGSVETEHLYVALATEGGEAGNGVSADYRLQVGSAPTASVASLSRAGVDRAPTRAQTFHDRLRAREHDLSSQPAVLSASRGRMSTSAAPTPPVIGAKRTFDVCATTACDSFVQSTATAKVVGQRVAIFLDDDAPTGYTQADLDNVGLLFDNHLHPIDTTAFGTESDLDDNGVVIVLLTQRVNELSPDCNATGSVILGFFFGLDLLPSQTHSNGGEVFYGLVPGDVPTGCVVSKDFATETLPGVFIHEFQHMISFNQHVLVRGGTSEDTWLNEGLSHFAEELGGEGVPDAFCMPAYDNCESQFNGSNISNAYGYMDTLENHFLIEPGNSSGSLEERGANWLFVRWLTDQFAATLPQGTDVTRALVQTDRVGSANVAAVAGDDFSTLVSQWQMANYLTSLSGFTPSSDRLGYTSLNLRGIFLANFNNGVFEKPYPLTPDVVNAAYDRTGKLRAGSGRHLRIVQPAGSGEVAVVLTNATETATVAASAKPRIALVRVR